MEKKLIPTPRSMDDINVISCEELGRGWGVLQRYQFRHRRFDGDWSDVVTRDIYYIGEVSMVIPYDPRQDAVLLIEQFRTCGLIHHEPTWLVEVIAGMIDQGETPEGVAKREALEEAGCEIGEPVLITRAYSSPGGYGERSYMFAAPTDLTGMGGFHGLAHEHEDIRAVVVPLEDAYAATQDGRIEDAKTMLMIQWLVLNKAKLA
ncbi:MAG: NUDIX domain-containing protein [Rhizobiales bacterium]|nr:NUDIX domain-containing protein [Hyphomicrobiales bacterium]